MLDAKLLLFKKKVEEARGKLGFSCIEMKLLLSRFRILPFQVIHEFLPESGNILEIGAGHGILSMAMASLSKERQITGFDMSSGRVEAARKLASCAGLSDNVTFTVADAKELTFSKGTFNAVFTAEVLYLIPFTEQEGVLKSIADILDAGSNFVICEPVMNASFGSIMHRMQSRALTVLSVSPLGRTLFGYRVQGAPFLRTAKDWVNVFERNGFVVEEKKIVKTTMYSHILLKAKKA